jgi:hypothetical protein
MQEYASFGRFGDWQKFTDILNEALRQASKLHQPTVISSSDNTKDDKKDGEWGISKSIFDFVTDL